MMKASRRSEQAGFTLVEMLVVIVIIAILAAFLIPAVGAARRKVHDYKISVEIAQLHNAVEEYKNQRGDYPPNSVDPALLRRHILDAFPKIDNAELAKIVPLLNQFLDPAEAIPFWLGGFSSDPKHPFFGPGGPLVEYPVGSGNFFANPERNDSAMKFDKGRLTLLKPAMLDAGPPEILGQLSYDDKQLNPAAVEDSFPVYLPYKSEAPFVYFDARSYGITFYPPIPNDQTGAAKPYLSDRERVATTNKPLPYEWVNEDSFQIVSAGRDNHYGSYACVADPVQYLPVYPLGMNYDSTLGSSGPGFTGEGGDDDNITNFSGGTLEDKMP